MASCLFLSLLFGLFLSHAYALFAIPGSPCHDACKGDVPPSPSDIVCKDGEFSDTDQGKTLQSCISCLATSNYAQEYRTDAFMFFYYLTLVQKTCLTDPEAPLSYCSSKCDYVADAFAGSLNQTWFENPYLYCSKDEDEYTKNAPNCGTCLQAQEGSVLVGNFVVVGNIACGQKPELWNNQNVSFDGNIFDSSTLDPSAVGTNTPVVTPSATASSKSGKPTASVSSQASATTIPLGTSSGSQTGNSASSTADSSHGSSEAESSGINRGAAAGIGIIVGIAGIAGVVGMAIFARKRRENAYRQRGRVPNVPPKPQGRAANHGRAAHHRGMVEKPIPAALPKKGRWTMTGMTPRTSAWYFAANPKSSTDLSALPQRDWR